MHGEGAEFHLSIWFLLPFYRFRQFDSLKIMAGVLLIPFDVALVRSLAKVVLFAEGEC